ncbi:MAG: hypothetical protein PHW97_07685, partial [Fermentimonas sp.]|nr:hypothetical protein [Fermentimonas sp.]
SAISLTDMFLSAHIILILSVTVDIDLKLHLFHIFFQTANVKDYNYIGKFYCKMLQFRAAL